MSCPYDGWTFVGEGGHVACGKNGCLCGCCKEDRADRRMERLQERLADKLDEMAVNGRNLAISTRAIGTLR